MKKIFLVLVLCFFIYSNLLAQEYFLGRYTPFDYEIKSPEEFLGYPIGSHHTRHDQLVDYFEYLAEISNKAQLEVYGETHEKRPLIIFTISEPGHLEKLPQLREAHLKICDPESNYTAWDDIPIFVNLGYGVHGNEPSSAEAAMLTAYTLLASDHPDIQKYLEESVIFIDPVINPDGRERHTQWANMYKGNPLVGDPIDVEHTEAWPRGRTNHYWFDLNRDWYLGINPESRSKLKWYHDWYPNVVTDFHEMGTSSTYFFEPMKANASKTPIMPRENYTLLNDTFAKYFTKALDSIGSLYFTGEVFDGTYPGYGSSYPDLQGGLALLFEQASSRGHLQERTRTKITFAFTIRNQYVSSMATLKAAVENKTLMLQYQADFFKSAISNARKSGVKAYVFGDKYDRGRINEFLDKVLLHKVKAYKNNQSITINGSAFEEGKAFIIPTAQPQYRMIQSFFETYNEYADSVYYDASAWSLANFYNISFEANTKMPDLGEEITEDDLLRTAEVPKQSSYAYLVKWDDYFAPAFLNQIQNSGAIAHAAFKSFSAVIDEDLEEFAYGTLMISAYEQDISPDSLYQVINKASADWGIEVFSVNTGRSVRGIDLGSGNFRTLEAPKTLMLIGDGISSYEAGEIWHLLDTRVKMPITKVMIENFNYIDFNKYNTMIMVSGGYAQLDSVKQNRLKSWIESGNTLITIRNASAWAINNKIVGDSLLEKKKPDSEIERLNYVDAREHLGKKSVGGAIFEIDLDITHPVGFGYHDRKVPVYRNSTIWIKPSKNPYSTVAKYTDNPHIDGFITDENLNDFLKPSASVIVSKVGSGRVVLFADNPNFRSSWLGTNKMLLNAIFLGNHIRIPQ